MKIKQCKFKLKFMIKRNDHRNIYERKFRSIKMNYLMIKEE